MPYLVDFGHWSSLNEEKIYSGGGDPYEYKVVGGEWFAKGPKLSSWASLKNKPEASSKLDRRYPSARSGTAARNDAKPPVRREDRTTPHAPSTESTPTPSETVTANDRLIISDSLANKGIRFDPERETQPMTCTEDGCAQWVSNQLEDLGVPRQGNAWHAVSVDSGKIKFNVFKGFSPDVLREITSLFTKINSNPKEKTKEREIERIVTSLLPSPDLGVYLKNQLEVDDIIGLYWNDSSNFTKAFFEGATGYTTMGTGAKVANGPYFKRKNTGAAWTPADLKKNVEFIAGDTLTKGGGFSFNTHLGYVGAIAKGEPIIFHNVHNTVHATPLSKMGRNVQILWIKKGKGNYIETSFNKFMNLFR